MFPSVGGFQGLRSKTDLLQVVVIQLGAPSQAVMMASANLTRRLVSASSVALPFGRAFVTNSSTSLLFAFSSVFPKCLSSQKTDPVLRLGSFAHAHCSRSPPARATEASWTEKPGLGAWKVPASRRVAYTPVLFLEVQGNVARSSGCGDVFPASICLNWFGINGSIIPAHSFAERVAIQAFHERPVCSSNFNPAMMRLNRFLSTFSSCWTRDPGCGRFTSAARSCATGLTGQRDPQTTEIYAFRAGAV